jgi:hypothetical protein
MALHPYWLSAQHRHTVVVPRPHQTLAKAQQDVRIDRYERARCIELAACAVEQILHVQQQHLQRAARAEHQRVQEQQRIVSASRKQQQQQQLKQRQSQQKVQATHVIREQVQGQWLNAADEVRQRQVRLQSLDDAKLRLFQARSYKRHARFQREKTAQHQRQHKLQVDRHSQQRHAAQVPFLFNYGIS